MVTLPSKLIACSALLIGAVLSMGCPAKSAEDQCQACLPNRAYRCPVGSNNNTICAADDAHALVLCPEGPQPLCGGGSGGQADDGGDGPEAKAPDAKIDTKEE